MSNGESQERTVAAVDRALAVMTAFRMEDESLSLAQLHERTGMYKSTLLRLLQTLEGRAFVLRLSDGRYQLGPATLHLGTVYQKSFRLEGIVMPALRDLTDATGESSSFFVAKEKFRTCLFRVESRHEVRHTVAVGEPLPIDRGITGKVLTLFAAGARGTAPALFDQLPIILMGKTPLDISVTCGPVFGVGDELKGAITVAWPTSRLNEKDVRRVSQLLMEALAKLSAKLGADPLVFAPRTT